MNLTGKDTALSFSSTEKGGTQVTLQGTKDDIMLSWIALTSIICGELGIQPALLAFTMPGMVADYERIRKKAIRVAFNAPDVSKGGDKP